MLFAKNSLKRKRKILMREQNLKEINLFNLENVVVYFSHDRLSMSEIIVCFLFKSRTKDTLTLSQRITRSALTMRHTHTIARRVCTQPWLYTLIDTCIYGGRYQRCQIIAWNPLSSPNSSHNCFLYTSIQKVIIIRGRISGQDLARHLCS